MKIEVDIREDYKEPKVIICADQMTDEIIHLMKLITSPTEKNLSVNSDRGIEYVSYSDIIRIYSENQKVYVQTDKGLYTVRVRLYELEQNLDQEMFIRISNSEIVNKKKIRKLDTSLTGTICVYLLGDIKTYVSRRYVARIKKLLGI